MMLEQLSIQRSGVNGFTQLDFIEKFILGKRTIYQHPSWGIKEDSENYAGSLFKAFLENKVDSEIFASLTDLEEFHKTMKLKFSGYRGESDGGITTRSHAPFLDEMKTSRFVLRQNLLVKYQDMISLIQHSLKEFRAKTSSKNFELSPAANAAFKELMQSYYKTMSNLPGGVHRGTDATMLQCVEKLNFDPETTVLLECGCGAPIFGYQASIFTKRTICIDLPSVMQTVYWILHLLPDDDRILAETVNLLAVDILEMTIRDFEDAGLEIVKEVTHITAFIGIPEGTMRFYFSSHVLSQQCTYHLCDERTAIIKIHYF